MVARVQPADGFLVVTFTREDGERETHYCASGTIAARAAIDTIAVRVVLQHGDTLTVRRADDGGSPELPEVSRSSHYS